MIYLAYRAVYGLKRATYTQMTRHSEQNRLLEARV